MNRINKLFNGSPPASSSDVVVTDESIQQHESMSADKKNYTIEIDEYDEGAGSLNDYDESTAIHTGLKSRHIQIISLAGAIGTGLFVGSGAALANCGPAGLLVGYLILSITVWMVMNMLCSMVSFIPAKGQTTVYALASRYTGNESLAFAVGLNLYYAQALICPSEITASAFVIEYWSSINPGAWIAIFWFTMCVLNFSAVKYFAETEFWIGSIKIITLVGLIIVSIVIFFGGAPDSHGVLGFHYWNNPGAFVEHLAPGNTGKFLACWSGIIKSAFAFILTPELIISCASEAEHPRINLPKATDRFIYRMIFFYVVGVLCIGVIVAYNDPRLMSAIASGSSSAAASPFVIGIQNAGIPVLNHIVNAAILTSAYSCGNAQFFGATRTLHSMALRGQVPKIFARTTRFGVPWAAAILTNAINLLAFLNVSNSSTIVFTWLTNISIVSGFISWVMVGITYIRFKKAIEYHNLTDRVPYIKKFDVPCAYFVVFFFSLVALTNGYAVFFDFNGSDFVAAYITLPIVFVLYVGHAIWTKNYRCFAPVEEIDCFTGLKEAERDEANYVVPTSKNVGMKLWYWLF